MSEQTAQTQAATVLANLQQQAKAGAGAIDPKADAKDGKKTYTSEQTSNKPAAPSKKEIKSIIESIDATAADRRTTNQNGMEFVGFLAKGPHKGKYVRDVLQTAELECVNKDSEFFGMMKPVKVPQKANYQIDGLQINDPSGKPIYLRISNVIDFLLEATWGVISASEEGRAVYVHRPSTTDKEGRLRPLQLRYEGASRYEDRDVIKTYDVLKEDGAVVTKKESIPLDTEKTYAKGETRENIRGSIEFPVFYRVAPYVDDLGDINTKENKTKKLNSKAAIDEATEQYALLFSHHTRQSEQ